MTGFPDDMVPGGHKIVSDQTECTGCGDEPYGGHFDDSGDFYCTFCYYEADDDIVRVAADAVICECGHETDFKTIGFGGDSLLWTCPRCREIFAADECDRCGRDAATNALLGRSGGFCKPCIKAIQDGGADE